MSKPSSKRTGIQSVGIGLRVLGVLASSDQPQALSAIAARSGLSSPQAHRYLASLIASEMAVQNPSTGRYDLGPGALRLGLSALARVDAFRVADQAISAFARETGRTVLLAALGPSGPVIIRLAMGSPPVITSLMVGSSLPLLRSATGRVFLAFRPEAHTRHMIEREMQAHGTLEPLDVEALRRQATRDGYAKVSGSLIPGLRATALPIFDLHGEAVITATVLATDAFPPDEEDAVRRALAGVCDQVSAAIGGRKPHE